MAKKGEEKSIPAKRKIDDVQSEQPPQSPNGSKTYKIGGLSVDFPYKAYGPQLAYMGKVIATLEKAQKEGHCHALLESPTGTGKSLALLCATLAWQKHQQARISALKQHSQNTQQQQHLSSLPQQQRQEQQIPLIPPTGSQKEAAFAFGGGFLPENTQSRGTPVAPEDARHATVGIKNGEENKTKVPTIFYASRTHSQISQVVREYKKTSYRVPMAILASRKHYCTNKRISIQKNVDEACKQLIRESESSCPFFRNAYKVKYHHTLRRGGCHEVHDIEDVVNIGHMVKGCSYFAARDMAIEAQLVFCPYNYIIHPITRKAMEVDIKGDIIILDEAHNIEDMSRDAGSLDVEDKILEVLQTELSQLVVTDENAMIYQPLFEMIQGLNQWIRQKSNHLEKRGFEHYCSCWTGDKALRELQEAGISLNQFKILQECAIKAIKIASDTEKEAPCLTGLSASTLENLFLSLTYLLSDNGKQAIDYQLSVQRYVKRDEGMAVQGWTTSLNLWCLNPSVVFKEIAEASLSVILTSGTLSPMNSFASELGVPFEICMEAPHVINLDTQVWAAAVSAGPRNVALNASYKTADNYEFQDALGCSLEEICKVVPNGILVFFPSYKLMDKLCNRWKTTGQWNRLNDNKILFTEPRGTQESFEPVLNGYYAAIHGRKKGSVRKLKNHQKKITKSDAAEEISEKKSKGEAAFLAVCRGKVSEGIDFSDENARAVVVVGIPFPNTKDIQIALKKRYNDTYKSSKGLLSGDQWYCNQAFRALNQAIGRCIRHRLDFGAIILLDERFKKSSNLEYMSKWLRNSIKHCDNFERSLEGLKEFFLQPKERKSEAALTTFNGVAGKNNVDISDNVSSVGERYDTTPLREECTTEIYTEKGSISGQNTYHRQADEDNGIVQENTTAVNLKTVDHGDDSTEVNKSTVSMVDNDSIELTTDSTNCPKGLLKHYKIFNTRRLSESPLQDTRIPNASKLNDETPLKSTSIDMPLSAISHPFLNQSMEIANANNHHNHSESSPLSGNDCCTSSSNKSSLNDETPVNNRMESFLSNKCLSNSFCISENCNSKQRSLCASHVAHETRKELFGDSSKDGWVTISKKQSYDCTPVPISQPFRSGDRHISKQHEHLHNRQAEEKPKLETDMQLSFPATSPSKNFPQCQGVANKSIVDRLYTVSCNRCDCLFGLPEKQFLIQCCDISLRKSYFNTLKNVKQENPSNAKDANNTFGKTHVIVTNVESVSQDLLKRPLGSQEQSIWIEEDGCVYKALCCPQCEAAGNCVGVRVVAADSTNISLLDKVIFFRDCIRISDPAVGAKEKVHQGTSETNMLSSDFFSRFAYQNGPEKETSHPMPKSKMRLPRKL